MTGFKKLLLAFTVLGASAAAHAADDHLASRVFAQNGDKDKKSRVLSRSTVNAVVSNDSDWGASLAQQNGQSGYHAGYTNVSVSHNGIKLRQEDLVGRSVLSLATDISTQS
ncbi:hypothetical protein [Pseudomonas sp. Sample_22]|uniref:hypothetical protein n=1 Tax=Pseudomonas sp. Sample_22 TaxID=2448266 RepID=UPI0010328A75|nr:hypothetical protein [Pseudomonas sp. Sample_22]